MILISELIKTWYVVDIVHPITFRLNKSKLINQNQIQP